MGAALRRFENSEEPYPGGRDEMSAGNGSIMRLTPVPMFYARHPREAMDRSGESSKTTHATVVCIDACRYFGGLIVGALAGASKEELLSGRFTPVPGYWKRTH